MMDGTARTSSPTSPGAVRVVGVKDLEAQRHVRPADEFRLENNPPRAKDVPKGLITVCRSNS
jgi:hypothetical protein